MDGNMTGYAFCLTTKENKELGKYGGYPYALSQKSRWVKFNFEESSIDFSLETNSRFIIDGVVYDAIREYFIRESDNETIRLMLLTPSRVDCELIRFDETETSDTV